MVEEGQEAQHHDLGQLKLWWNFTLRLQGVLMQSNAVALASRCGTGRNCSYRAVRRKE